MHRRTSHATATNNGDASTTTDGGGHSLTLERGSALDAAANHNHNGGGQPKRRRKKKMVKSTAFSAYYRKSSSLSCDNDDDGVKCMMLVAALLLFLIGFGIALIMILWDSSKISALMSFNDGGGAGSMHINQDGGKHQQGDDEEQHHRHRKRDFPNLPASKIYEIPHSLSHIGDKSDGYALLRKQYDEIHDLNVKRSLERRQQENNENNNDDDDKRDYNVERSLQQALQSRPFKDIRYISNPDYDIFNCPDEPPEDYPYEWKTRNILKHWNPNIADPPEGGIHQGLCVFDYRNDYVKALKYRRAEVPFVVRGDPEVASAVERWNTPGYMDQLLSFDGAKHRAEYSENNHFMFWLPHGAGQGGKKRRQNPNAAKRELPKDWKKPTEMIRMTYREWIKHANVTDESKLGPDQPHWYFRLIGCGETGPQGECDVGSSEYLFDELTFFQPRPDQLYLVEPEQQKGIHCRFGMKGVIAENHFDASRNAIVVLGGARRYILSHPDNCPNMALLPKGHPSARHSAVDWTDPDMESFPQFDDATSNEIVMQAGDVLYLPTFWFHYIVSLSLNFQCNTRSGHEDGYTHHIKKCGF